MRLAVLFILLLTTLGSAPAQPRLTLEANTDRDLYLAENRGKIYLDIRIAASDKPDAASSQCLHNVAFVLDRSGSMDGAPIQALRQATANALNSLGPHDIVSVILFGSEVETLIEAKPRDQVDNVDSLLAQIQPAGGSALYDALNQAAAQLRRFAGPTTSNHLILVTDGPATKGPREFEDFSRLADVFAHEDITLSTIGLGPDFNEDLLAALARTGNGHFLFADKPEKLLDALRAEVIPLRALVARDVTLTVQFNPSSEKVQPYGWIPSVVKGTTITYHFPYVFAGQPLRIFNSATALTYRVIYKLATLRLSWKDVADGQIYETAHSVTVTLDSNPEQVRLSAKPAVIRTAVNTLISEGLQDAILQIDKGDFRRARRALRRARNEASNFNYDLEDDEIASKIHQLESYLTEVQTRGMATTDRKILRSGLFNQFDPPTADDTSDR